MKVYIPNNSKQSIGGGWTFLRNFTKAYGASEIVTSWHSCDVILITGATMTDRNEMIEAKNSGKKIVFRVDNIPRDSRNRGTAFSRMLDFARLSDYIIFQSQWALDYAGWWFKDNGIDITNKSAIIYNGVDTECFYLHDENKQERVQGRYVYAQFNRDENKRMTEAFYLFHQEYRKNKNVELWLVGQFSPELIQNNFDFFAGEDITYLGVIQDPLEMGDIFRGAEYLLFPAFADASPNTVMEAMACGCKVIGVNETGGTRELLDVQDRSIEDMANDYKFIFEDLCQKR